MTTDVQVFSFEDRGIRIVSGPDGEPWFVARDVCDALALDTDHVARTVDDEDKGRRSVPTPGGLQLMVVINESGLYCLILGSRKPEAKRFRRWVTHEVLPTLRKTGGYVTDAAAASDPILAQARMVIEMRLQLVSDDRFGTIGAYPLSVLERVFVEGGLLQ